MLFERLSMERRQQARREPELLTAEIMNYSALISSEEKENREEVEVLNVNESGMLYFTENKKNAGDLLMISFTVPGSSIAIRAEALVVHCFTEGQRHKIGTKFKNLGLAERKLIQDFMEEQAGDE